MAERVHLLAGQCRNEGTNSALCDGLHMVQIDGTISGHAVQWRQQDFRRDVANYRSHRGHSDFPKVIEYGIPFQDDDWPALVRLGDKIALPALVLGVLSMP